MRDARTRNDAAPHFGGGVWRPDGIRDQSSAARNACEKSGSSMASLVGVGAHLWQHQVTCLWLSQHELPPSVHSWEAAASLPCPGKCLSKKSAYIAEDLVAALPPVRTRNEQHKSSHETAPLSRFPDQH